VVLPFLASGCAQQMAEHGGYKPLTKNSFFRYERSARPIIAGTVARGQLRTDTALYEGRKSDGGPYVTEFPFEMTKDVLDRGRQRFDIFCSVCHGLTGHAYGRIVKRGFTKPPDYVTDLARGYRLEGSDKAVTKLTDVPVGYMYDVITRGYGAMPDHAAQVPGRDRWAIVGYIRAVQYSQSPELRKALEEKGRAE